MSFKLDFTCSHCSTIPTRPFSLPCGDTICQEHLTEPNVCQTNSIECQACHEVFEIVDDNEKTSSNEFMQKLTESELYLSDEENAMKLSLEESIQNVSALNAQLKHSKNAFDLECHSHFEEMRHKVAMQSKQLKETIDKISTSMLEQINEMEVSYSVLGDQILNVDIKDNETILNSENDVVFLIKQLQLEQNEAISSITTQLNQLTQVKKYLKQENGFEANTCFNNLAFGSLVLSEYSNNPFKSKILDKKKSSDLIKICGFRPNVNWTLLYRGSRDGFSANAFHAKCDGHSQTLTIVKSIESGFVFGGFIESKKSLTSGDDMFIFGLSSENNVPYRVYISKKEQQILPNLSLYDSLFSGDLRVREILNCKKCAHPHYAFYRPESQTFLAGSGVLFQVSEIEVYCSSTVKSVFWTIDYLNDLISANINGDECCSDTDTDNELCL
jgi:hypothetical protein